MIITIMRRRKRTKWRTVLYPNSGWKDEEALSNKVLSTAGFPSNRNQSNPMSTNSAEVEEKGEGDDEEGFNNVNKIVIFINNINNNIIIECVNFLLLLISISLLLLPYVSTFSSFSLFSSFSKVQLKCVALFLISLSRYHI